MTLHFNSTITQQEDTARNGDNSLVVHSDEKFRDQRILGPKIPIISITGNQHSKIKELYVDQHVVLVYVGTSNPNDVIIMEFYESDVRVNSATRDLLVNQGEYQNEGLWFLWEPSGSARLSNGSHRLQCVLIDPVVEELMQMGLLDLFMRTSSPDPVCTRAVVEADGFTKFKPDYAKLLPAPEAD